MDPLKEAFSKIKEDMNALKNEIESLKEVVHTLSQQSSTGTNPTDKQTNRQTDNKENMPLEAPKRENIVISTGNEGVPTDKQTNRQTDKQTKNTSENLLTKGFFEFKQANELLNSLGDVKRETIQKFKELTSQEMLVLSTLYQLEEQETEQITYRTLANTLQLSESSIRDYITKLIQKGILIEKIKEKNKRIFLKLSKELKNVVSLDTILALKGSKGIFLIKKPSTL